MPNVPQWPSRHASTTSGPSPVGPQPPGHCRCALCSICVNSIEHSETKNSSVYRRGDATWPAVNRRRRARTATDVQAMVRTMPLSTPRAAPLLAEACFEQAYTTMFVTSSTDVKRWGSAVGRCCFMNEDVTSSVQCPTGRQSIAESPQPFGSSRLR